MTNGEWRAFRALREVVLERACERALTSVRKALDASASWHQRYLKASRLMMRDHDADIALAFDNPRRTDMLRQLAVMYRQGWVTDQELEQFSPSTRDSVTLMAGL